MKQELHSWQPFLLTNLKEHAWTPKMAAKGCEPNIVVSCAPVGEWIVSNCFVTCCKTWLSLFLSKKCVIYTTKLAWLQYDLSKVTWFENQVGMASTPAFTVWSQPLPEIRLSYARSKTRHDAHCSICRFYTWHKVQNINICVQMLNI